ncbi:hypothetical protein Adt_27642 [Abeliophyllum distichum]|uniref:Uncharacterized protein n=1 Tax=Abeliophyllum distichum TaxID=126358 RepID=A0ABD1RVH6_9LAMI
MRYMLRDCFIRSKHGTNLVLVFRGLLPVKKDGCCELNEIVMNRLSQIEFKQQELERNQAQIISLHNDLRKKITNSNKNVQGMLAEFLNQFRKETGGSFYNVLDKQIVLYTGDISLERKVEDQNPKGNGVNFDTFNNENVGHSGADFEDADDDDYILVDDSTPDKPRNRLKKAAIVFRSPYTSNF